MASDGIYEKAEQALLKEAWKTLPNDFPWDDEDTEWTRVEAVAAVDAVAEDLRAEGARWAHEAVAAKFDPKYPSIARYIRALGAAVQPNESEED